MNDSFGFREGEIEIIRNVIITEPSIDEAIIFGSRAKGNYHPGSDVDIALKGTGLTLTKVLNLSYILNEETNLPYHFDLLDYNTIKTPELTEHIDRVGVKIFPY